MYNSKRHMFTPGKPGVVVQKDSRGVAMKEVVATVNNEETEIGFNTEQDNPSIGLYLPEPGDVELVLHNMDQPIILRNLNPGMIHPLIVKEVRSTNTTAPEIMVVY